MSAETAEQVRPPMESLPTPNPGRYLAENGRWFVQLRVEADQHMGDAADVSADLRSREQDGEVELWVKTRAHSRPSTDEADGWCLDADWLDGRGGSASGSIEISAVSDSQLEATFTIHQSLAGLVPGFALTVRAARVSLALRDVGLEIDWEDGQKFDLATTFRERLVEVKTILHDAGLDVHDVGQESVIPSPVGGSWSGSDVFNALNEQLRRAAQAPLTAKAWELHLLLLSKTDRQGLLGLMFDVADTLPRQGAAVFVQEIRDRSEAADVPQRVLATAIHELGHCLNLTHRFTREVGLANSSSFMNYDWLYKGGNQAAEYWKDFRYEFDKDELEFLRHAPRDQVIPGGAPFGSARYWVTPEKHLQTNAESVRGLQLWLTPRLTGPTFSYGEPIFLQVSLRNLSSEMWCLPRHTLDVKAGMLEVLIRRRPKSPRWNRSGEREPYLPFMRRCFAVDGPDRIALQPGESLHDNLNLTFGSAGSPFVEPGDYVITPVLTLYDQGSGGIEGVVEGAELLITVKPPVSSLEERDAQLLQRGDVGVCLGLGGADCLVEASEALRYVVDRRSHDGPLRDGPDGVVAAGTRMLAIDASRRGDRSQAYKLLGRIIDSSLIATFDPHTASHTRQLATKQTKRQRPEFIRTHLDITTRAKKPGTRNVGPIEGVLVSRASTVRQGGSPAEGVAVLVDASAFIGDEIATASALVSSYDGLTERIAITSIETFYDDSPDRPLALALLSRTVPASSPMPLPLDDLWTVQTMQTVRAVLARHKVPLPRADRHNGFPAELSSVMSAERGAPWASPAAAADAKVSQNLQAVASLPWWLCKMTNRCQEAPPGTNPEPRAAALPRLPSTGCQQSSLNAQRTSVLIEETL